MKRVVSLLITAVMLFTGVSTSVFISYADGELIPKEGGTIVLDREKGYIRKIEGTQTAESLSSQFEGNIEIKRGEKKLEGKEAVATDDEVSCGEDKLKALIYGDVDRDGRIDTVDVIQLMKYKAGWSGIDISEEAADVNDDKTAGTDDVIMLMKYNAGWNVSLGDIRMTVDNSKQKAEYEDSSIDLYFDGNTRKIDRSDVNNTGLNTYEMHAAKNEVEFCQMVIAPDKTLEGISVSVTDFKDRDGNTLKADIRYGYYLKNTMIDNKTIKYWADPLVPIDYVNGSIKVEAGNSQVFFIDVTTESDSKAGLYEAVASIYDADGHEIKRAKVYTYVWNFAYPEAPSTDTLFYIDSPTAYGMCLYYGIQEITEDTPELYKMFYDFLLDYRLSGYYLPYSFDDERVYEYLNDPRVSSFVISDHYMQNLNEDEIKYAWNLINTNETWLEKGVFYYVDEPYGQDDLNEIKRTRTWLKDILKTDKFHCISPFGNSSVMMTDDNGDFIDPMAAIAPYVSLWIPSAAAFVPRSQYGLLNSIMDKYNYGVSSDFSSGRSFNKYGEPADRLYNYRDTRGDILWWYVCITPTEPFPNFFGNQSGIANKVLFWNQYRYEIEGLLYWHVANWEGDEWRRLGNCDGRLTYPGGIKYGNYDPIASMRLEIIRDGLEDVELFLIAEEVIGRDAVLEVINTVTADLLHYTENDDVMKNARIKLGDMVEAGISK